MTVIGYILFIRAGQRWIVTKMHVLSWIKVPSFSLLRLMESYQYECSEKYAEMQTFYTYVLLKHCHMENLSICIYMCIHHSEITTAVRKKKGKKHQMAMFGYGSFINVSVILSWSKILNIWANMERQGVRTPQGWRNSLCLWKPVPQGNMLREESLRRQAGT